MLNDKQLTTMLTMQNKMNQKINSNWISQDWNYMRAIALESTEAIEHHGWKWWKAQQIDMPQLQMELIDVWHFYLSRYLQINNGFEFKSLCMLMEDIKNISNELKFDGLTYKLEKMTILEKLDLMCGIACAKRMSVSLFFSICKDVGLSVNYIYEQYVQKNTLNIFRQAKGYKEGTYHKNWFGEEDNVYLVKIASTLDSLDQDYSKKLWFGLEKTYEKALAYKNIN